MGFEYVTSNLMHFKFKTMCVSTVHEFCFRVFLKKLQKTIQNIFQPTYLPDMPSPPKRERERERGGMALQY
jgi:hypothetical protein